MKFEVPDSASIAEALEIFRGTFEPGGFFSQEQVGKVVQLLENPKYSIKFFGHEVFPGRTTLERHDYLQAICNAEGSPDGEAFVIGATMGSTGDMNAFKAFLYLWMTNLFAPAMYHYPAPARGIFYRTVKEATKLSRAGILKDMSQFPIEKHTADRTGLIREELGLKALFEKAAEIYGEKISVPRPATGS